MHSLLAAGWNLAVASAVASSPLLAQMTPLTPSPPHEALTFFEGTWTIEERPAEAALTEICGFLEAGRRHMVCRSRWRTGGGPREAMSIFSFDPADSLYVYLGLRPGGAVELLRGRRRADGGWEFGSEQGSGSGRQRIRVTITPLEGRRFRLVAESALGDGQWQHEGTEHYRPIP